MWEELKRDKSAMQISYSVNIFLQICWHIPEHELVINITLLSNSQWRLSLLPLLYIWVRGGSRLQQKRDKVGSKCLSLGERLSQPLRLTECWLLQDRWPSSGGTPREGQVTASVSRLQSEGGRNVWDGRKVNHFFNIQCLCGWGLRGNAIVATVSTVIVQS